MKKKEKMINGIRDKVRERWGKRNKDRRHGARVEVREKEKVRYGRRNEIRKRHGARYGL